MMQQQMAAYAGTSITTELIQKYLDENKQLILAILDNQNLGKLNECATYQAKLQQNLMYLAAIADAQPQGAQSVPQAAPAPSMQPAQQYLQQQQQQLMMGHRNLIPQYLQQSQPDSPHMSQQSFLSQQGMVSGGSSGMHVLSNDTGMGGNGPQSSGALSEYGKPGGPRDSNQMSMGLRGEMRGGGGSDIGVSSSLGHPRDGPGQGGDESEASYLKGSDEDGQ